jgi:integrase
VDLEAGIVAVWRSDRVGGDTKTARSRRTLELPRLAVDALAALKVRQARDRLKAGELWQDTGLVFTTRIGTKLLAGNVRRAFRAVLRAVPGIDPEDWTPRELRHTFVSLLSEHGMPIEEIARLAGHASTKVTESVYRHELRPAIASGARAFDALLGTPDPGPQETP